jgi:hypothetical protein
MMINGPRGVAARSDPSVTRDKWIKNFAFNEALDEPTAKIHMLPPNTDVQELGTLDMNINLQDEKRKGPVNPARLVNHAGPLALVQILFFQDTPVWSALGERASVRALRFTSHAHVMIQSFWVGPRKVFPV